MKSEELLTAIHAELVAIRQALETKSAAAAAPVARPMTTSSDEVPQPTAVIADAGSVTVHFGKNTGIPLSSLSEDRKSTRLNSSHVSESRMPSSA